MNQIERSSPELSLLLGQIRDGLLLLDPQGRIVYTNRAFEEMTGRGEDELRGRTCDELFDEATCCSIDPRRLPPIGDTGQAHFNIRIPAPDGTPRSYCFIASPVRDPEGRLIGILENFRGMDRLRDMILDLEEVNRAIGREKEKTESILNSLADGIFTVDRDRRILSFSDKMERLTGLRAVEAVGRSCMEVLRGTKCESDCPLAWSFGQRQVVERCSELIRAADGRAFPVFVTTAFLHDAHGEISGLTGVVHDRSELERLRQELRERRTHRDIIGRSRAMQEVFQIIETVADSDATILIGGESGTGKELVAKAIHDRSARRDGPFVMLNCASLNDNLLESELFGHVRGAFTGAVRDKPGRFEMAGGGTLFLDEIGDTTPALQIKLLRVLQEKAFERVGDTRTRTVDVRIIAATHRDLKTLAAEGRFREDLYYRLAVVPVQLPPLRERREDIPLLVQHFIDKYRTRYFAGREQEFEGISNRALALLMSYDWPGNVRELEHAVEYAMISTTTQRIERAFLPAPLRRLQEVEDPTLSGPAAPDDRTSAVEAPEAELRRALVRNRWNATRTARELGVSRTTLWRRMKRLDLLKSIPPPPN
jgi:PAS domain S-box-containing protein